MIKKGRENISFTIVEHKEVFYGRHTALSQAVVKVNG